MAAPDGTTLDHVFGLAQRLPAKDKIRLIERLAPQVEAALSALDTKDDGAWNELLNFSKELGEPPSLAMDSAELLSSMRR